MNREEKIIQCLLQLIFTKGNSQNLPDELFKIKGLEELYMSLCNIRTGIEQVSKGNLDFNIEGKGYVVGVIKNLQASLRHLTWQVKTIEAGDFSQKVNFLGDFSEAFNSMTEKLRMTVDEFKGAEKEAKNAKEELEKAYKLLKTSEERILQIFEHSPVGILYYNPNGNIENLNNRLVEIIGTPREKLMKYNISDFPNPRIVNSINKSLNGEMSVYEGLYHAFDSEKDLIVRFSCAPIISENGRIIGGIGIVEDFTARKRMEEEIRKLSITDKLTQIYNRLKLDQILEKEVERSNRSRIPFAVILLDIDYFKSVNDTYGHQARDKILQELANLVKENIRETDIFGRWGGEEFLIIAVNSTLEGGIELAEKLRKIIEQNQFSQVGHLTCSFGVSAYTQNSTPDSIVSQADEALYRAKRNGRNKVEFF